MDTHSYLRHTLNHVLKVGADGAQTGSLFTAGVPHGECQGAAFIGEFRFHINVFHRLFQHTSRTRHGNMTQFNVDGDCDKGEIMSRLYYENDYFINNCVRTR
jgi:hypothetical protein